MLRYLASCGISPGECFEVRDHQPFGGPLFVVFGEREHAIGGRLAAAMRVEVTGEGTGSTMDGTGAMDGTGTMDGTGAGASGARD
jgi:Fe2+ transport system protein FeoA